MRAEGATRHRRPWPAILASVADWTRRVVTALVVIAAGWAALMLLLWATQRSLVFLPDRSLPDPPADVSIVPTETDDGVRHRLWVVPAAGGATARVVVFNGNAGNRSHRLPLARTLAAEGLEVVLFDYRGYGDTGGAPTEDGLLRDGRAAVTATFRTDLPLVYFGESIGAAVATGLSSGSPPAALVLRSPFTSLADMARIHYRFVPPALVRDRFDVEEAIASVDAPVLVVLGTSDSIVPPRLSRRVYEAAAGPKDLLELDGLNHNDAALTSGEEMVEIVADWIDDATG